MSSPIAARMIQDFTGNDTYEPHWGYAYRVVPCKNDAGSCAYLDAVYEGHDIGMIYTGIFWLTVIGILFALLIGRRLFPARDRYEHLENLKASIQGEVAQPAQQPQATTSRFTRLRHAVAATVRRYLLPNSIRVFFGHTTRLQVLILVIFIGYLTIWSFVGITYGKWVTPVKAHPGKFNTRTSLGPWADRVGVLAYALTPLSVLFASRESLLSLVTGIPYTSFMFLHRWTGYIILLQSILHTIGWVLIEAHLYQPQPEVWTGFITQTYAIWGVVALVLLVLIWFLSLSWTIRRTGYEFFRKMHYVLAMVYIGACIGHWDALQCFLVPGIVLWVVDRSVRLFRMWMLHYGYLSSTGRVGFAASQAEAMLWRDDKHGDVVRLDFEHPAARGAWEIGQHFFLCFTEGSIWQSHPFTPLSLPLENQRTGGVKHSYVFRAKQGETRKIAKLVAERMATSDKVETPVVLQGPYGENITEGLTCDVNVLCVAGGTGVTYVLPVLLSLVRDVPNPNRKMELVWAVKREQDTEWIAPELEELRILGAPHGLEIRIVVTDPNATLTGNSSGKDIAVNGEKTVDSDSSSSTTGSLLAAGVQMGRRPDVGAVVAEFVTGVVRGPTRVFGSGPPGMIGDLRGSVAKCNSGAKVWKGEERYDVRLVCDDRMEW